MSKGEIIPTLFVENSKKLDRISTERRRLLKIIGGGGIVVTTSGFPTKVRALPPWVEVMVVVITVLMAGKEIYNSSGKRLIAVGITDGGISVKVYMSEFDCLLCGACVETEVYTLPLEPDELLIVGACPAEAFEIEVD